MRRGKLAAPAHNDMARHVGRYLDTGAQNAIQLSLDYQDYLQARRVDLGRALEYFAKFPAETILNGIRERALAFV